MLRKPVLGRLVCVFLSLLTGAPCPLDAQEPKDASPAAFNVGVASIDITPFYPVRLNGFGSRREESEGTSQKLWAKALAISHGDRPPFVLLAIDSLGVREPMVDMVAAALQSKYQIPRQQVALTFTHTHCAPKVDGASDTIFSTPIPLTHQLHIDRYGKELTKLLIEVASEAVKNRQPATLEWQSGRIPFAVNRRTPGGPVDHELPVLMVRDASGKPFAIYTSYACHCVTLSFNRFSGDWAGYAQESIEELFPGSIAMVSIGCGSDSNPESGVTGDRTDVAAAYGRQIGEEVKRIFQNRGKQIGGPLTAQRDSILIGLDELPSREELEALSQQGGPAGYNASWQLARLDRGESLTSELNYPVQSFTFGEDLQMVFLAGEVCVDYSQRLKRELNRDRLWINGYSNDFCAYIPSERLLREGGYGGGGEIPYFALPSPLKPGLEQQIIDAVKQQTPAVFHLPEGTQGVPPKSPEEALSLMEVHNDLQIELVAAEPLISDPVAIDFGSDGRLWVAEMPDYSRGVSESFEHHGRIRFLTDTNDDGQFDTSKLFLTGLRFPTDVKVWRDGILVCDAPEVLFAADRDGDGVAEIRKVILSGFATHNPHARVNSLRFGWDGWVYGSGGLFGGQISSSTCINVDTANRDFRFNPDTGIIESASGQTQQGRTRDDFGNWFGCTNGALLLHYPLDERYAVRAPQFVPPTTIISVPSASHGQRLFPPTNLVTFKLTGAPGRPTSACGAEIYRDQQLGESYFGDAFVCEPVNQLVHRLELDRDARGHLVGNRAGNETNSEFLRSTDQWFRPVQCRTGTDGALYIVDMYRYVIEHPQWIPEETRSELNLLAGQDKGRIYRITRRGHPKPSRPRIAQVPSPRLVELMNSTNGPLRDLVQQELRWRQADGDEIDSGLMQVARDAKWPAAKLQALATLASRGRLPEGVFIAALQSSQPEVRRALVQLSEGLLPGSQTLREAISQLALDSTPEVEVQLAFTSAGFPDLERIVLLEKLVSHSNSPWLEYAALTALKPEDVSLLWAELDRASASAPLTLYRSLVVLAAARPDASAKLVNRILATDSAATSVQRWLLLSEWLRTSSLESRAATSKLKGRLAGQADIAMEVLVDNSTEDETRIAALEYITELARPTAEPFCRKLDSSEQDSVLELLGIQYSPRVQSAALVALAALTMDDHRPLFLNRWDTASPRLRGEMIDRVLKQPNWIRHLLELILSHQISPGELNATHREKLSAQSNPELVKLAKQAFASMGASSRTDVLEQWKSTLQLTGSYDSGRTVFAQHCAACHRLDGVGHEIGPDLAAVTNRTPESMFVAILDPNRDVDSRYLTFMAITREGQVISGLLTEETAVSVTLKEREEKTNVLLRSDLETLRSGSQSAMPEGIEKDLSKQNLADLIAYLVPPRIPPKTFVGNQPRSVTADRDGRFELQANEAEIFGTDIIFESNSPFKNIGYWHGAQDRVAWNFDCNNPGRFDVVLDYACDPNSAGNRFLIRVGQFRLTGEVESTGGWSEYRQIKIGSVDLSLGLNRLEVGFGSPSTSSALFDLKRLIVSPAKNP